MNRKLPPEAFEYYYSLGVERNYAKVAQKYDVSKQTVVRTAVIEGWQERIKKIDTQVRERCDQKLAETVEEVRARHTRTCQAIQGKAIEVLKRMPLDTAMEAVRALDMAMKQELKLREEAPGSGMLSVEAIVKREYALIMAKGNENEVQGQSIRAGEVQDDEESSQSQ